MSSGWRTEEDYLFARLASALGYLDSQAVEAVLRRQAQTAAAGIPLSFSQVVTRDGVLEMEALLHVKGELAACARRCGGCGQVRYLAAGPQAREEPCTSCGAPIPIPAAGTGVTGSYMERREAVLETLPTEEEGPPRSFANFEVEAALARGAMGAIYRARDTRDGRVYALKVLIAGSQASQAQMHRFRREARAQQELDHPHIAKIHEAGEWQGMPYYTMDLVTGGDLARVYPTLELAERVRVLALAARGVEHAHEHGYVHRDLKLANVLLTDGNEPRVTDFGLTRHLEGTTQLTQEGTVLGTPFYMSPEQVIGRTDAVGPRSDVYSLGVMLYELCTGTLPFVSDSTVELAGMIIERRPPAFAERGCMAPELEQVAFRALEKDPELRYASAGELADDLERVLRGEQPRAGLVRGAERVARQVQKHQRSIAALLGMVIAGLLVLVGVALWLRGHRASVRREGAWQTCERAVVALESKLATPDADALLAEARRVLDEGEGKGLDPAGRQALGSRIERAMVRLARIYLRRGSGPSARRALELVVDAGPAGLDADGLAISARAILRTGKNPAPALAKLRELAPDDPRLAFLGGLTALVGGRAEEAARRLAEVAPPADPFEALEVRAYEVLARVRAKQDAAPAVGKLLELAREPKHPGLRRAGEILLLAGRVEEATTLLTRAAREHADPVAGEWLVSLLPPRGRGLLAAAVLEGVKDRSPQHELAWLRVRTMLGEDHLARLKELGERLPAARLAWADLRVARGEDPKAHEGSQEYAAATRARHHGLDEDEGLEARIRTDLPRDLPARPGVARAARDLAWALYNARTYQKLDVAGAVGLVRAALRGLPDDLDGLLLLGRLTKREEDKARYRQSLRREVFSLDTTLGRGLFLARLNRLRPSKPVKARAKLLLQARLAADPALSGLASELGKESEKLIGRLVDGLLGGKTLFPPLRRWPRVSPELRRRAEQRLRWAKRAPEGKPRLERLRQAVAIDPQSPKILWALALARMRAHRKSVTSYLGWFQYLRRMPEHAFRVVSRLRRDWIHGYHFLGFDSIQALGQALKGPEPDPDLIVVRGLMRTWAVVYPPSNNEPKWGEVLPHQALRDLDGPLLRDPRLWGLLYVRAQVLESQGDTAGADRELALLAQLERGKVADGKLFRAWILANTRPRAAIAALAEVELARIKDARTVKTVQEWLNLDPMMAGVRQAPEVQRLMQGPRKRRRRR